MSRSDATVYIVDDDASVREALAWLLRSRRLLSESFDSAEAFEQALGQAEPAAPACLLLDVRMPGASGLDDLYITDNDQLPSIVRTQVDVVLPQGAAVLSADDAEVLALADYSDGEVILYSVQPDNADVAAHRARKGRAVLARGDDIVLATGGDETVLLSLSAPDFSSLASDLPADVRPHVLAAVAAAWALGVPTSLIRGGLLRFDAAPAASAVH